MVKTMKKASLAIFVAGAICAHSALANVEVYDAQEVDTPNTAIEEQIFGSPSQELMEMREEFLHQKREYKSHSFEMLNMLSPHEINEGYSNFA